jgi:hypothetical protein
METVAKVRTARGAGHNPETRSNLVDIARETGMTSQTVSSCRTRKKGMVHTNRKVTNKVKILLMLLVMIILMMLLLLLLDVLRPMMSGYLTMYVLFICARIEIGLLLLILLLLLVSFLGFDNSPCKIEGIGSVRIKMFDGTIRTLTDVRYIPKMKRNLISVSALDAKGYKYSGGDSVLKVTKGSLIVMKGDLSSTNGLYYLRGSTVSGNATPVISKNSDCDAANLWHMRLGHMSELGLAELNKRGLLDGYETGKLKFCEHCIFGKHKRVKFIQLKVFLIMCILIYGDHLAESH